MADEPLKDVQPGDLITARLINLIIKKLKDLEAALGGEITVPTFFGQFLLTSKNILNATGSRLVLSSVRDATGLLVSTTDATQNNRVVIGQVPPPGARVMPNTPVYLLVSAQPGSGTGQQLAPRISGFSKTSVNIGDRVDIHGTNFMDAISENKVWFDDEPAPVLMNSTSQMLAVNVPTGIEGAPTAPGQQKEVTVRVETIHGSGTNKLIILPPLQTPNPTISSIAPVSTSTSTVRLGTDMRIVGSHFGAQLSAIRVFFGNQPVGGVTPTAGSNLTSNALVVTVPNALSGLDTVPSSAQFAITVQVGSGTDSRTSSPFPLTIWRIQA